MAGQKKPPPRNEDKAETLFPAAGDKCDLRSREIKNRRASRSRGPRRGRDAIADPHVDLNRSLRSTELAPQPGPDALSFGSVLLGRCSLRGRLGARGILARSGRLAGVAAGFRRGFLGALVRRFVARRLAGGIRTFVSRLMLGTTFAS
jgi:hypothetical protein